MTESGGIESSLVLAASRFLDHHGYLFSLAFADDY
jgi:hypothetical protein